MDTAALRDIKPPLLLKGGYGFLIALLVLILLAGIVYLIVYLLKRRKKKEKMIEATKDPAHIIAYRDLENLKAKELPKKGKIKEYFFELSNIARHYIENRFLIKAPDMTTEEFLISVQDSEKLESKHKDTLREFLTLSDIVKFAKYGPTEKEIQESFDVAIKLVDETKIVDQE